MQDTTPLLQSYQYEEIGLPSREETVVDVPSKSSLWTRKNGVLILLSTFALSACVLLVGRVQVSKNAIDSSLAAFAVRNPGDPLLPGDEMLNQQCDGSPTSSLADSVYRMVYDEGTIKLYAKSWAITTQQKSNWNTLWTAAKNNGGWGQPYWDMSKFEQSRGQNMNTTTISDNGAILIYTPRQPEVDNKAAITFVDPNDDTHLYYEVRVAAQPACDKVKLVLGCDGNLVLVPYKSSNPAYSCPSNYQSNPFNSIASNYPTRKPTASPVTAKPTKQPVSAKPTKKPVTAKPTKKPVTSTATSEETVADSNEEQQVVQE